MKKLLTKFVLVIVASMFIFAKCDPKGGEQIMGASSMKTEWEFDAMMYQIDSVCLADTLPTIDKWIGTTFTDYETKEKMTKKGYIKQRSENEQIIYTILIDESEPYWMTKINFKK